MGHRRRARELAMQALFYLDTIPDIPAEEALEIFRRNFPLTDGASSDFFLEITGGVIRNMEEIDPLIERFSTKWKLYRMSAVDRNVMRIAVYEMLFCDDIPAQVSINEAIDIGKKYGSSDSGAFINGILDGINKTLSENGNSAS